MRDDTLYGARARFREHVCPAGGVAVQGDVLRNRLLGQWAATRLGLSGDAASAYIASLQGGVLSPDSEREMEARLHDDFDKAEAGMSDADIRAKMAELLDEAVQRTMA